MEDGEALPMIHNAYRNRSDSPCVTPAQRRSMVHSATDTSWICVRTEKQPKRDIKHHATSGLSIIDTPFTTYPSLDSGRIALTLLERMRSIRLHGNEQIVAASKLSFKLFHRTRSLGGVGVRVYSKKSCLAVNSRGMVNTWWWQGE